MFKKEENINMEGVETIIGQSVTVEGDFEAAGNVIVEGKVVGNIKTNKFLRVGNSARITANVAAESAIVAGEIEGNITIKEGLELLATAKIFGDIKTKSIIVAAGAIMNGKCVVGSEGMAKTPDKNEKIEKIFKSREWKMADENIKAKT